MLSRQHHTLLLVVLLLTAVSTISLSRPALSTTDAIVANDSPVTIKQDTAAISKKDNIFKKIWKGISGLFKKKSPKKPDAKRFKHEIKSYKDRSTNIVDSIGTSDGPIGKGKKAILNGEVKRDSLYKVFGWHPHWLSDAYQEYDFNVLSTLAYFSYEVEPSSGNSRQPDVNSWGQAPVIDSALKAGCEVLLTVTNFGADANQKLLDNPNAQANLIRNLVRLLQDREAQGVNVDFEQVPVASRDKLSTFIATLRSVFADSMIISMTLPAVDLENAYDIAALMAYVDYFVVMGYGYYGEGSHQAGPSAPLNSGTFWWDKNITTSMAYYEGLGVPKPKLLLGLPYFGTVWEAKNINVPSKARFVGNRTYSYIMENVPGIPFLEPSSQSVFRTYTVKGGKKIRQLWFDNDHTLATKYDWIKTNGYGGVGIWALGFDRGRTELWDLLRNKFTSVSIDTPFVPTSKVYLLDSALRKKLDSLALTLRVDSIFKIDSVLVKDSIAFDYIKDQLDSIQELLQPDSAIAEQESEIALFIKSVKQKADEYSDLIIMILVLLAVFAVAGIIASPVRAPVRKYIKDHKTVFQALLGGIILVTSYFLTGILGLVVLVALFLLYQLLKYTIFNNKRLP